MTRSQADLTPDEILAQNEETYDELISLIENSQGRFSPIIVACDGLALRQRIIDRYEAEAWETERIRPSRVRLGQDPSLRAALAALVEVRPELKQEGKAVVTVTGAELLLRVKTRSNDEQTELEQFFGYLQWTREGLREFRYPIVLWVSSRILREMSRRAPDFWSWRKAVLRFVGEDRGLVPEVSDAFSGRELALSVDREEADDELLPSLEELLTEIGGLEAREGGGSGLATLYGRLGQVYARRIRRGEALAEMEAPKAIAAFRWAIDYYQAQGNLNSLATMLNRLAGFYSTQSQFAKALEAGQSAVEAASQVGNKVEEMISWRRVGNADYLRGSYPQAIAHYQKSLKIAQEIGDQKGEAATLGNLGSAYQSLGQYQRAIDLHQQSLEINREVGDRSMDANFLGNLGNAYALLGQYQLSIDFYQRQYEIAREIGNRSCEALSLGNLGSVYQYLGLYQKAIDFHQQAFKIKSEIGDRASAASSLMGLGNAYQSLGQYQRAIDFYQPSIQVMRTIGDRNGEATALFNLACAQVNLDDYGTAQQNFKQSKVIFTILDLHYMVEKCDKAIHSLIQLWR